MKELQVEILAQPRIEFDLINIIDLAIRIFKIARSGNAYSTPEVEDPRAYLQSVML